MTVETLEENAENAEALAEGAGEELELGEGEPVVLEDWEKSDEDLEKESEAEAAKLLEGEEIDDDKPKPEKTLKAKKKLQRKLEAQTSENDELRAENARLKESKATPEARPTGRPVRPKEEDFETDEEYEAARDQYGDEIYEWRQSEKTTKQTETQAQEKQAADIKTGVDGHFERAEALIESGGISHEKYNEANAVVRAALDAINPGKGDFIADYLISKLGKGSEKVFYQLGRNAESRAELVGLLREDPNGSLALVYLAKKSASLVNPTPKKSKAPAPAPSISGSNTPGGEAKFKKDYDAAMKSGNHQKAMDLRTDARRNHKINTKNW